MRGSLQQSWTLVIVVSIVFISTGHAQNAVVAATEGLACEGGHASLACPASTYINIQTVLFGRSDNNITCPHSAAITNVTNCAAANASLIVGALCQGRPTCDIYSSTSFFNDPCPGVYKYLQVMYTCSPCVNNYGNDAACEMMALQGQCQLNTSTAAFMAANCARACYKCEASIAPVCTNAAPITQNCAQLASQGQCLIIPANMTAFCKQSCGQCLTSTPCVNSYNTTACNTWFNWQPPQCTANPNWMLPYCTQTCFACTQTIKCQNQNPLCDTWAQEQQCTSNPGYMIPICTQSCLGCTSDPACMDTDTVNCPVWAGSGFCSSNAVWMFQNCWKSCTQCAGAPACLNNYADALCEGWAKSGQCATGNVTDMYLNCRKSCTRCAAWPNGTPNCVNFYNATQCNAWAAAGNCVTNTIFMYANCYASCTGCQGTTFTIAKLGVSQLPGTTLASTASYNIILPFSFTVASIVTEFIGYFASTNPIYLQVWRPNGTNAYYLVNQIQYTPTVANASLQVLITSTCMLVNPGDQIGFTSIAGPASVASSLLTGEAYTPIVLKQVTYTGSFFPAYMPLSYSLAAAYTPGTSCSTTTVG